MRQEQREYQHQVQQRLRVEPAGSDRPGPAQPVLQAVVAPFEGYHVLEPYDAELLQEVPRGVPAQPDLRRLRIEGIDPCEPPRFDGASIPWFLTWFLRPMEPRIVPAALVHDALYARGGQIGDRSTSRRFADLCFFVLMHGAGIPVHKCWFAYLTVRAFGRWSWRGRADGRREDAHDGWEDALARQVRDTVLRDRRSLAIWGASVLISVAVVGGVALWPGVAWTVAAGSGFAVVLGGSLLVNAAFLLLVGTCALELLARARRGVAP